MNEQLQTDGTPGADGPSQEARSRRFVENWRTKPFVGRKSYTLVHLPNKIQDFIIPLFRNSVMARMRELRDPGKPLRKLVDMACGAGDWSVGYLEIADSVVGFDVNAEFVEAANELAREATPAGKTIRFEQSELLTFDDYADVDAVCLGACAQLLTDDDLDVLLERISHAIPPGGVFYVRATVVNPAQKPWKNWFGCYRKRADYERRFRDCGFEIVESAFSQQLVVSYLLSLIGLRWLPLSAAMWSPMRLLTMLRGKPEYVNWFMRRA
jgi:SAM-dependent methyltransferase